MKFGAFQPLFFTASFCPTTTNYYIKIPSFSTICLQREPAFIRQRDFTLPDFFYLSASLSASHQSLYNLRSIFHLDLHPTSYGGIADPVPCRFHIALNSLCVWYPVSAFFLDIHNCKRHAFSIRIPYRKCRNLFRSAETASCPYHSTHRPSAAPVLSIRSVSGILLCN